MGTADATHHERDVVAGGLPRFSVVDIETSGLSSRRHRMLQVAVVTVEGGEIIDEWESLVKLRWPFQRVGPTRVHGIRRRTLRSAPQQQVVLDELSERLSGTVFTAHNVGFDWPFIARAARRSNTPIVPLGRLCTLQMSRALDPERTMSHRLGDLCARHGVSNERPHDALHDARATAMVLGPLLDAHGVTGVDDLERFYER